MAAVTTGRFAYLKLATTVKLQRGVFKVLFSLGRLTGKVDYEAPQEVIYINSSKSNRTIRINVHRNKAALSAPGPTAVHMNWHGGGWMLPSIGQNAAFIHSILNSETFVSYPITILDCTYALSPEYPAPADIEDARDAYDYVLKNPEKYDSSRITCSGFSSGGTVALGLSVDIGAEARNKAGEGTFIHPIKAVMTFYPSATWLDEIPKVDIPSGPKDWPGMVFPDFIVVMIYSAHFFSPTLNSTLSPEQEQGRIKALKSLPKVSPACADPNDFPPSVVIYTAEYDFLAAKANELRETLEKAGGREVSGKMVMKAGHGWDLDTREGTPRHNDRVEAYETCIRAIAKVGGL